MAALALSLFESCISELARVSTSSINPSLFLHDLLLLHCPLSPPSVSFYIRTRFSAFALVSTRNSCRSWSPGCALPFAIPFFPPPLVGGAFSVPFVLKFPLPIRSLARKSHSSSCLGKLMLAWADASLLACLRIADRPCNGNFATYCASTSRYYARTSTFPMNPSSENSNSILQRMIYSFYSINV